MSGLNTENKCKWAVLHKLYAPDDAEWQAAANAPRWDSASIPEWAKTALDNAWAAEQAQLSRQEAEQAKEAARVRAAQQRTKRRARSQEPINKFLKKNNLVIVHEAKVPKQPDALALENPNSLDYKNRRTKRKTPPKESSDTPSPGTVEEAKGMGIWIVPKYKKKRHALGSVDSDALKLANQAVASTPVRSKKAVEEEEEDAIAGYYKKKLLAINRFRTERGNGELNINSCKALRDMCSFHYNDKAGGDGFVGTGLQGTWDRHFFLDYALHPASDGETDLRTRNLANLYRMCDSHPIGMEIPPAAAAAAAAAASFSSSSGSANQDTPIKAEVSSLV